MRRLLIISLLRRVLDIFELKLLPRGYYRGYNDSVNPTVANAFGAAAFRFGHSLVKNSISRRVISYSTRKICKQEQA